MNATAVIPRDTAQVVELLVRCAGGRQLVGSEVELAIVSQDTLAPTPYAGPRGIGALLQRLLEQGGYAPEREDGTLIALTARDGERFTLEPGGQVELSTRATRTLADQEQALRTGFQRLARAADDLGLAVVAGGLFPAALADMPWMPKGRYRIMREYFASLGEAGQLAHSMMQRTLSTQVSLDYAHEADGIEILRLAFQIAPIATGMFATTPFDGLEETDFVSFRGQIWNYTDPHRQGDMPGMSRQGSTFADYVEHALDAPMMFRIKDGEYLPMRGASFRDVLNKGAWGDGVPVTEQDIWDHLNSIFTNARLKCGLIELRSTDGQAPDEAVSIPAFWVGVFYDHEARAGVRELLDGIDPASHAAAVRDVPRLGLETPLGERTLGDVARDLVALAQAGIQRRIDDGLEPPTSAAYLQPLADRLAQGLTKSCQLRRLWNGAWQRDPARLIEHLRIKPE